VADFIQTLVVIVGKSNVIANPRSNAGYRHGFRFGSGPCEAVVRPGTLLELWRVVQACVEGNRIVIIQAANTGLTGGSTPNGDDYDRHIIVINTKRLGGIQVLDGGRQVVCLPGSRLYELESILEPLGREPHSVIGSSCIGASVIGGICNNSGGALIRRGPAYTEFALYARVSNGGALELVNHLGIRLGDTPEEILSCLDRGAYGTEDVDWPADRAASDQRYADHVRQVDAPTAARFNADPSRLFEASGSAGRMVVFAVRLDTFPKEEHASVFYIGSNDPTEIEQIRRRGLAELVELPIAVEYIHRDAFHLGALYGKDLFLAIQRLGAARLPALLGWKKRLDDLGMSLGIRSLSDRLAQFIGDLLPNHLPQRINEFHERFDHHLIFKTSSHSTGEMRALLQSVFSSSDGDFFQCAPNEANAAFLHRFVIAGAAVRFREIHHSQVEDILALDIALCRNDQDWLERLPDHLSEAFSHKLYYGHFFCHVLHQDYIVRRGHDVAALKRQMLQLLDERGAEYPAEHNVGHLYHAKPSLSDFYRQLDPTNSFNVGIGQTSKQRNWG